MAGNDHQNAEALGSKMRDITAKKAMCYDTRVIPSRADGEGPRTWKLRLPIEIERSST